VRLKRPSLRLGDEDIVSTGQRPYQRVGKPRRYEDREFETQFCPKGRARKRRPKKLEVRMQLGNNKNAKVTEITFGISVEIQLYFDSPEVSLQEEVTEGAAVEVPAVNFRFLLNENLRDFRIFHGNRSQKTAYLGGNAGAQHLS